MQMSEGISFDPETISMLRGVLDEAWSSLPPKEQAELSKTLLAERILKMAAKGERDPIRLRTRALTNVVVLSP
jgi:site-specific recombinase XerC